MDKRKPNKPYYYADGKRVTLEPAADLVAVDDARLAEKFPDLTSLDSALQSATPLRGGIRVVQRNQLDANTLERLQSAGVTQPVFRQGGATLVALPEIRIEDDCESTLEEVRKFAVDKVRPMTGDDEGRLTLRPLSGDGGDALALANELVERFKPASVSPRFLRIVSGPLARA
jgi:hypothetical protein